MSRVGGAHEMTSISRRGLLLAVATVTAVLALAAGVAFAVLPGGGVVEACVAAKSGAVRVVDSAGDCSSKESPLSFYSKSGAEAAFLGAADKAADAELLDGIDSSAFVRGGGQVIRERVSIAPGGDHTFSLPLASVKYTCPSTLSDPGTVAFRNTTAGFEQMWMDDSSSTQFEMFGVSPFSVSTTATG